MQIHSGKTIELAVVFVGIATAEIAPFVYDVISTRVVSFVEERAYIYISQS
jgi:hypothetical protein